MSSDSELRRGTRAQRCVRHRSEDTCIARRTELAIRIAPWNTLGELAPGSHFERRPGASYPAIGDLTLLLADGEHSRSPGLRVCFGRCSLKKPDPLREFFHSIPYSRPVASAKMLKRVEAHLTAVQGSSTTELLVHLFVSNELRRGLGKSDT